MPDTLASSLTTGDGLLCHTCDVCVCVTWTCWQRSDLFSTDYTSCSWSGSLCCSFSTGHRTLKVLNLLQSCSERRRLRPRRPITRLCVSVKNLWGRNCEKTSRRATEMIPQFTAAAVVRSCDRLSPGPGLPVKHSRSLCSAELTQGFTEVTERLKLRKANQRAQWDMTTSQEQRVPAARQLAPPTLTSDISEESD